jgi:hypothetical protein
MSSKRLIKATSAVAICCAILSTMVLGQTTTVRDPGVRGGPAGGGTPVVGINHNELAMFQEGLKRATELESTCDGCSDITPGSDTGEDFFLQTLTNSAGLGARFNGDSCMVCHSQPAIGGSGGFLVPNPKDVKRGLPARPAENPSFDLIPHRNGQTNVVPSFITRFGPIREVRFAFQRDGDGRVTSTPDGGVHQLWTIVGRDTNTDGRDDPVLRQCTNAKLPQPNFEREVRDHNIAFRIPLQLFGLGLIDSIDDREILARHDVTADRRADFGIAGVPNRSGNDGTITRFGWKAQNKSLTVFAGEAYNVENGVTNELFPQATADLFECNGSQKPHPNDIARTADDDAENEAFTNPLHLLADWMQFTLFMRFLDAPQPAPLSQSAQAGRANFDAVGCTLCHTPQMKTAARMGGGGALENKEVNLYSDLLTHHMGANLADNISQGLAGPDEFRSQPLWGVGQRRFFLHDGRTDNLIAAIQAHASAATAANPTLRTPAFGPSEANASVARFNSLSTRDKQSIIDFLRAL